MARFVYPTKGSPEAFAWAARMQAARKKKKVQIRSAGLHTEKVFFGPRGVFAKSKQRANPGAVYHQTASDIAGRYKRRSTRPTEKALFSGMEMAHADSAKAARSLGMNPGQFYRGTSKETERRIPKERQRHRKNPLAVFSLGNPPKRINATVAGVVYSRCLEIRAEKLVHNKGLYKHPFSRKSGVQILALDNGDLLIHSTRGVNLWEPS